MRMPQFRHRRVRVNSRPPAVYSLSNHPQWGGPNNSYGGTTFGQITSASGARNLTVALKFYY